MIFFNYNVEFPFSNKKIYFRELNTKEQLALAKANLTFGNDKESLVEYNNFVLEIISNCIKDPKQLTQINIVEYVLFLVKLRIISVGNQIEFLSTENNIKTKIKLDLKSYLNNLYVASTKLLENDNDIVRHEHIEIKLNWPNISSSDMFLRFLLEEKNYYDCINDSLIEYIEYIKFKDKKILFNEFNKTQKNEIFDTLSFSLRLKIIEKLSEQLKCLFECEVFDVSTFKQQKFNFYNLSFIEHIKLFYSYDVKSIHQELYFLSNCNLPPEYIMTVSPIERRLYFSIVEEHRKSQESDSPNNQDEINMNSSMALQNP